MNKIDWAPTDALLVIAIGSATGGDVVIGNAYHAELHAAGVAYDARYGGDGGAVDLARGAFLTAAAAAVGAADHAAKFAESLVGSVGASLTFDPSSPAAILDRLAKVTKKVPKVDQSLLETHAATVSAAFARSTSTTAYFDPQTQTVQPIPEDVLKSAEAALAIASNPMILTGDADKTKKLAELAARAGVTVDWLVENLSARAENRAPRPRTIVISPGVRDLELDVVAAMGKATAWFALLAY